MDERTIGEKIVDANTSGGPDHRVISTDHPEAPFISRLYATFGAKARIVQKDDLVRAIDAAIESARRAAREQAFQEALKLIRDRQADCLQYKKAAHGKNESYWEGNYDGAGYLQSLIKDHMEDNANPPAAQQAPERVSMRIIAPSRGIVQHMLYAIKEVRALTGLSLIEAKNFVEAIQDAPGGVVVDLPTNGLAKFRTAMEGLGYEVLFVHKPKEASESGAGDEDIFAVRAPK